MGIMSAGNFGNGSWTLMRVIMTLKHPRKIFQNNSTEFTVCRRQLSSNEPSLTMVIIDAYTHYAPPRLMSFLSKHSTDGSAPFSDLFSKIPALTDLDGARIKLMDDKGVDTHVLVPLPWIDPVRKVAENEELALEACRICNEEVRVFDTLSLGSIIHY